MTETIFEYDHLLMRSEYRTPDIHSHLALHLIIGLGAGIHCRIGDECFDTDAVFIMSDIPHTAYSDSGEMLVFLFDPACQYANDIDLKFLHGGQYACLNKEQTEHIKELWDVHQTSMRDVDIAILEYLGLSRNSGRKMDERIVEVLAILREMDEVPENAVDFLCSSVCLSKSRISHLFKENLGVSLSRYLSWEKMRKGYIHFQKYGNITDAAIMAGFDSPSHFAATCKRMFGISFSEYTKS